jgi:maltose phosphorylase
MAGTWMSFVKGFGGMRIKDNQLYFAPFMPKQWEAYSFKIRFRGHQVKVKVSREEISITNHGEQALTLSLFGEVRTIEANGQLLAPMLGTHAIA